MTGSNNKKKGAQSTNSSVKAKPDTQKMSSENVEQKEMNDLSTQEPLRSSQTSTNNVYKRKRVKEEKGEEDGPSKKGIVEHQNSHGSNEEKKHDEPANKKADETGDKSDQTPAKKIGGIIFMCNTRTKPDCFRFRVMGIQEKSKQLVMDIKPGLKLFLFDIDTKMMYGLFEASSDGGMKLEPTAFGGAFPAQVRFTVHTEYIPIHERVFKKAIIDNYDQETRRFGTKLSYGQVKRLTIAFRDATRLHGNVKFAIDETVPTAPQSPGRLLIAEKESRTHSESPAPLFLTEKEYRTRGLQSGRSLLPCTSSLHVFENKEPSSAAHVFENKEPSSVDRLYLSEKEYRAYGLKGLQGPQNSVSEHTYGPKGTQGPEELVSIGSIHTYGPIGSQRPQNIVSIGSEHIFGSKGSQGVAIGSEHNRHAVSDPYDESTALLVNRYLSMVPPVPSSSSYYSHSMPPERPSANNSGLIYEARDPLRHQPIEGSYYSSGISRDNQQQYRRLDSEPNPASSGVSSRYAFVGPYVSRR